MRAVVAIALLLWMQGPALAACQCACIGGEARNLCEKESDMPVICMRLCLNVPAFFNEGGGGPMGPLGPGRGEGAPMAPMAPVAGYAPMAPTR